MNPEAIEALLAAGWQLVPPNPTREMINAMAEHLIVQDGQVTHGYTFAWRAALEAVQL